MGELPVLPYPGGAVLQAGPAPSPGKDGDPETLPDYMRLGRVIEPVRAKICIMFYMFLTPKNRRDLQTYRN